MTTELIGDEAYYWYYAQSLGWGYFDHPPMVAVFVKIGTLLLGGELGVRLMTMLSFGFTLLLLWRIILHVSKDASRDFFFFLAIVLSLPIFHIYSFITTPDVPLIFFSTLFLWIYLRDRANPTWYGAIALAFVGACVLYSKYHGVLWIGAIYLYGWRCHVSRLRYYGIILLLALFYAPHIVWQFQHGLPAFSFQFIARMENIGGKHIIEYIANLILIFNPILFGYIVYALIKRRIKFTIHQLFPFLILFVIIFFLLISVKSHVAPHWLAIANIPFVVLLYQMGMKNETFKKNLFRICYVTLFIMIPLRLVLMFPSLPIPLELFQNKKWTQALAKQADGLPVVFVNSYQKASWYAFYTHQKSYAFYLSNYHKSEYDIRDNWKYELQNKPVMFVGVALEEQQQRTELTERHYEFLTFSHTYKAPNFLSVQIDSVGMVMHEQGFNSQRVIYASIKNNENLKDYIEAMQDSTHVSYAVEVYDENDKSKAVLPIELYAINLNQKSMQFVVEGDLHYTSDLSFRILCLYENLMYFPISNFINFPI